MSETKKLITFCVPSYNSEEYLHYALDSLIGHEEAEVLIIDDGSKDGTLAIAQEYQERYPEIFKAIHQENKGHGGAINTAVSLATGEYFKVLDSDDWVDKGAYDKLIDFLKNQKNDRKSDLILMDYVYQQGRDNPTTRIGFRFYFPTNEVVELSQMRNHMRLQDNVTLHSAIYRLAVIKESGVTLPEHCSYEDNYFVYAPMGLIKTVAYIPEPLYQYLIGRDGQSMTRETCIRKYHDFVRCGELIFRCFDVMKFEETDKKRYRLMRHHLILSMIFLVIYPQLNGDPKAIEEMNEAMKRCEENNPKQYAMVVRSLRVSTFFRKGKPAKKRAKFWYSVAHLFVKFN